MLTPEDYQILYIIDIDNAFRLMQCNRHRLYRLRRMGYCFWHKDKTHWGYYYWSLTEKGIQELVAHYKTGG